MSRVRLTTVSLITLTLALAACSGGTDNADNGASGENKTIRMAVTDLTGLEELQREFGAFETTFEEASGYQLEFFPVSDRAAAAVALESDQVDLVFTGPAEYVAINRPGYHSCVYTTADSGITSLEDLRGEKVGMTDVGSTSGHLGPSWIFMEAGINPLEDIEVLTVGDTVHEALVRGDIAAVGVGYHDYEEQTADAAPGEFVIITEGEELPPDVIMAREGLPENVREDIRTTFSENWDALLTAMLDGKDNAKYEGASLVETNDADYNRVREMYRAVGVEDFANAPE